MVFYYKGYLVIKVYLYVFRGLVNLSSPSLFHKLLSTLARSGLLVWLLRVLVFFITIRFKVFERIHIGVGFLLRLRGSPCLIVVVRIFLGYLIY
jgi:hypothetical protein